MYTWEQKTNEKGDLKRSALENYDKFILELDLKNLDRESEGALKEMFLEAAYNCLYYKKKVSDEKFYRFWYVFFTIFLAVVVPIILFVLSINKYFNLTWNTETITLAISVLLTIHTLITKLLEKRVFLGQFMEAFYSIQEVIRSFTKEWKGQNLASYPSEFLVSVEDADDAVRAIVQNETISYYKQYKSPSFDLASIITGSRKAATSIVQPYEEMSAANTGAGNQMQKRGFAKRKVKPETLAYRALQQHGDDLTNKLGDALELLQIGLTKSGSVGLIAYVNRISDTSLEDKLSTKIGDAQYLVPFEQIEIETGEAHSGFDYRLRNRSAALEYGSIGAVLVDHSVDDAKFLVTCSHVALGGVGTDLKGKQDGSTRVDVMKGRNRFIQAKLMYAQRNKQMDLAILKVEEELEVFDNQLPHQDVELRDMISLEGLKMGETASFYSSLDGKVKQGVIHSLKSELDINIRYNDGIKKFKGLMLIGNNEGGKWRSISEKGDSGSVLYNENYEPFALVIGSGSQFTYAMPIKEILEKLNKTIYIA